MLGLADFLESRGADVSKRTNDRFFGDKLNRDPKVKMMISRSKKVMRELKSHFDSSELDMLSKLIDNKMSEYYDSRSHVALEEYSNSELCMCQAKFNLYMSNMPNAIKSQLDETVIKKKFSKVHYGISSNGFGITQSLYISVYGKQFTKNEEQSDMDQFIEVVKYILNVIKPVFADIIEYKDDWKDKELLDHMKWRKEQEKQAKKSVNDLMK